MRQILPAISKQKRIGRVSVFYYEEEGQLNILDMKKLPGLMHNLMHTKFQIMDNRMCITFL